jgi:hypothetical protein
MTQAMLALFGLASLWMAMSDSVKARKFAPCVGLAGQPSWIWFAWEQQAWGLGLLAAAYTAVYLRGAWMQWKGTR